MVPMRDGVRLATDVYRPARDGRPLADRRPVLLHCTPYNKVETEATSRPLKIGDGVNGVCSVVSEAGTSE